LRDRAVRIVRELSGTDRATAAAALEKSGWVVKEACERLERKGRRETRVGSRGLKK
jgi:N-acetylmuramic acid 6-phosphate (MurNAc-6-P) etherase